jgi:teichuronic acid biosynthesis glycosyltransferase TuaC
MADTLRALVITRLFPNAADPFAAAFNRQQFAALGRLCAVDLLAVIPWFPGAKLFSRWSAAGRLAQVPPHEWMDGLFVRHPRVFYLPRVGHALAPLLYEASLSPLLHQLRGRVDVVLGSWAFPDGVAAVRLARKLGVPSVIKLHGSDMNVIANQPAASRWLRWALPRADRVVAVSQGLADKAQGLGVTAERLVVVPNGVDRTLFFPRDRAEARAALGTIHGSIFPEGSKVIVYVGRLERAKGITELLDAFRRLASQRSDVALALVGDGGAAEACRQAALEFPGRVVVAGVRPLDEVATWIAAGDLLTLPSWNEGTPNVVLEALASGRRVVATTVGGIPDVLRDGQLGQMVPPRDASALTAALTRVLDQPYDPSAVAAMAPGSWADSAGRLLDVLMQAREEFALAGLPSSTTVAA